MVFTSAPTAPLIVVFGATGSQGGSVVRHLGLSSLEYRVRAITRDTSKPASQALAQQGVEVYQVELGVGKVKEVAEAVKGAAVVFGHSTVGIDEEAQAKTLVDAVKAASVPLFIWPGLPSYSAVSSGKYNRVIHFDGKARVTDYARSTLGPSNVVVVQASPYFSNFFTAHRPAKQSDGSFVVALPNAPQAPLPWIDVQGDYGAFVVAALEKKRRGEEIEGGEIRAGLKETYSFEEVVKVVTEVTGKKVVYKQISPEQLAAFLAPMGLPDFKVNAVLDMWCCASEFGFFGGKKTTDLTDLGSKYQLKSFRQWVEEQDWTQVLG